MNFHFVFLLRSVILYNYNREAVWCHYWLLLTALPSIDGYSILLGKTKLSTCLCEVLNFGYYQVVVSTASWLLFDLYDPIIQGNSILKSNDAGHLLPDVNSIIICVIICMLCYVILYVIDVKYWGVR